MLDDRMARLKRLELRKARLAVLQNRRDHFLPFVQGMWPEFVAGKHHHIIAEKFEALDAGRITRLIITMPPRHTKSEFASFLLPAWMIGKNPRRKIIEATHTAELAVSFGRKVKNLLESDEYQETFPGTQLAEDSKASGRWNTTQKGDYHALGVGGAMAGKGADLLVIDDPHSEADALSPTALQYAYEWFTSGPRQRLQPGGRILIVMTRWGENDLVGNLLRAQAKNENTDQWEVVSFPALLPSGNPTWPEMWSKKELLATKASIPLSKWNSQYQQDPTSDAVSIIKREWWQRWEERDRHGNLALPPLQSVIQAYDTAYSNNEASDFSAISTWGVFQPAEDGPSAIILLDCKRGRWDFPTLKTVAKQEMAYWEPETVIIEAKASGLSLAQELRRAGVPVVTFSPSRGNDRMTRVNSVAPVFESGLVWAPGDSSGFQPFAEELIEECAAFPRGQNDDMLDTAVLAIMRYRKGNYVRLETDVEEEPRERRLVAYY